MRVRVAPKEVHGSEASDGGGNPDEVWGGRGIMAKDILPDDPSECSKRYRLRVVRTMDRLELLDEANLTPTLTKKPEMRWLVDATGARWDILAELGRIGEKDTFEEALRWVLQNRPGPEKARAYVCRLKLGACRQNR